MWVPFFCLFIGLIFSRWLSRWSGTVMFWSLLVLLFAMGVKIGAQPQVFYNIPRLGLKAVFFFLVITVFTLGVTILVERWYRMRGGYEEKEVDISGEKKAEVRFMVTVLAALVGGIACGRLLPLPLPINEKIINYSLWVIFISVGMGMREGIQGVIQSGRLLLFIILPVVFFLGSLAGGAVAALLTDVPLRYGLAIGGGMGYYSVTGPLVTQAAGADLGFIAFLCNFLREILTFFLTPLLVRFSSLSPLALGGATSMDTTLAVIRRYLGEELALAGFVSGVVLTVAVPIFELFILM